MYYYIPVYVLIETSSNEEAEKAKKSIENLVSSGFVTMALKGAGVPFISVHVTDPVIPPKK